MYWLNPVKVPAVRTLIWSDGFMAKGEILHWARETEAEVGAGSKCGGWMDYEHKTVKSGRRLCLSTELAESSATTTMIPD
jgi:hypothetical protein